MVPSENMHPNESNLSREGRMKNNTDLCDPFMQEIASGLMYEGNIYNTTR